MGGGQGEVTQVMADELPLHCFVKWAAVGGFAEEGTFRSSF